MLDYKSFTKNELIKEKEKLIKICKEKASKNLSLNISRGKLSKEQLNISNDMLNISSYMSKYNIDTRNYGEPFGLLELRELFSSITGIEAENIVIKGNSTLNAIYDTISDLFLFGDGHNIPWKNIKKISFLCPVPGYDRHFSILEKFGINMINIETTNNGIDMDTVESLCLKDDSIKGIICVPKYSNPTGICYDDDTISRLARLKTKAKDFKIFLDNAYMFHYIYKNIDILNIYDELKKYGNENRLLYFFSTSKINFSGSGICMIGGSRSTMSYIKNNLNIKTIGYDKISQLKTAMFLKDKKNILSIMDKHKDILKEKFDICLNILKKHFDKSDILTYTKPLGGYFICVYTKKGIAKSTVKMCGDLGLIITKAGSTYPYGIDKNDSNIRLAPSFLNIDELKEAMDIFCVCVKLSYIKNIKI